MLVSKAANLNESQIQELANLQRGVAAIYQNEWTEPVLCHIEPHERGLEYSPTQSKHSAKDKVSSEELRYLNSCVLNPFKLDEPREYNFCDCVHKMDIPDSMKARLIEMAGTPLSSRKHCLNGVLIGISILDASSTTPGIYLPTASKRGFAPICFQAGNSKMIPHPKAGDQSNTCSFSRCLTLISTS
ncbi:hypothetical protein [Bifidobacterium longum]|uniref:hypothetical protein n=1 Tax=Bifidobacterium longum TaxID=216816 RepID=UPI001F54469C|nr:hypothetical protein [Bifidobacterium longum]